MAPQFVTLVFREVESAPGYTRGMTLPLPGEADETEALRKLRAALAGDATLIGGTIKAVH